MTGTTVTRPSRPAEIYAEVQQFYAEQFQLLDAGAGAEWAGTFTAEGSFLNPLLAEPTVGRDALAAAVDRTHRELAERNEQHRHVPGNVAVQVRDDGSLLVRSYTLVYATVRGGEPRLHRACTCTDVLVHEDGGWKVAERVVTRDDM